MSQPQTGYDTFGKSQTAIPTSDIQTPVQLKQNPEHEKQSSQVSKRQ